MRPTACASYRRAKAAPQKTAERRLTRLARELERRPLLAEFLDYFLDLIDLDEEAGLFEGAAARTTRRATPRKP